MKCETVNPVLCSFLEQVGSEASSSSPPSSPPAADESGRSDSDVPVVLANITDLINQSYEVRNTHEAGADLY